MAEFYFDYQIDILSDELGAFSRGEQDKPRLFIERDYRMEGARYVLYLTLPRWDAKGKSREAEDTSFDTVDLLYDVRGIDTVVFDREDGSYEVPDAFDRSTYRADGFRYVFLTGESDFSGVGKIILKKNGKPGTSVAFFAINFAFKKKIRYRVHGGKIILEGKDIREGLRLRLNNAVGSLPCLADDRKKNDGIPFTPDFSKKSTYVYTIPEECRGRSVFVTFDILEKDADKFYLLECIENDTVQSEKREFIRPKQILFCPYCHSTVELNAEGLASYKSGGGVGCNGQYVIDADTESPTPIQRRVGSRTVAAKNVLYCAQDFQNQKGEAMKRQDVHSLWPFSRLLPEDFLAHNHFKVAVVGSKRAGKTTFISRMFDITGSEATLDMPARMMTNATGGKGFTLASYAPRDLDVDEKLPWIASENPWFKNKDKTTFYSAYSIDIAGGRYPTATDKVKEGAEDQTRNPLRFPFIFEVGHSDYLYFYDIAGEDAESSGNRLAMMIKNAPTGIFFLVDGKMNQTGNNSVCKRICEVLGNRISEYPIAVILTKFDQLEHEFDPNCHCLRSDVYDMMRTRYEGSLLEKNIELASEEICAYLTQKRIRPDFPSNANVRYFGMSSFADSDAVFHQNQTGGTAEVNYLRYASSAKRMELPLIWMLRQFGCIV